jgi:hypothetical protein
VVLSDARAIDRCLRVTWHPASSTVVFSHWNGSVCTASTPVRLPEASKLIDLLVDALRQVAELPHSSCSDQGQGRPLDRMREWLRPGLRAVSRLPRQLPTRRSRPEAR